MVNGVSENPSFQFSYWFLKCKFGLSKKCTEKNLAKKLYCLLKWTQVPEKSFLGKKTYPLWIGSKHQQCAVVQFSAVTRLLIFSDIFQRLVDPHFIQAELFPFREDGLEILNHSVHHLSVCTQTGAFPACFAYSLKRRYSQKVIQYTGTYTIHEYQSA
jgi:hypothetical protein